ncbi:hypothetical protein Pla52o_01050 [Novipirellula galeiformis]|uniref:YXWGXW repeat (2 copies) n=1 Tax=Novipirellula galeiformis TaxID=2528004 RepID=A0A5C6CP78_9BACT|nr:YXWGXW repeat-containing protein [Novipirellula galeiformis]TWU26252.1 hypothetical protein Pla52o_01050 [Novipirellula galeiformis]
MTYLDFRNRFGVLVLGAGLIVPITFASQSFAQPPTPTVEVGDNRPAPNSATFEDAKSDFSEGIEYLTRGPLHEAFAGPYKVDPIPGPVVAKEPPEPIDELPPEYRPSGKDVVWIPGYWGWDDERDDFIWVSGVWRDLPPGQQWVPGYWHSQAEGYQYVGGFWARSEVANVDYLPSPPESLEQGPASPAPGENYFYIPGNWVYRSNDYQWQPGFWSVGQENWVWIPAQYVWTPRGCVYQAGYWDYDVAHRGVAFTPVYYSQPLYRNAGYSYRPRYTIDTGIGLFVHLFTRPSHSHYYFGDYYGSRYANHYQPWATHYRGQGHYDPFYSHYSYRSRRGNDTNLISWITNQYQTFERDERYRPARTIAAQRDFVRQNRDAQIDPTTLRLSSVGDVLSDLANSGDSNWNLQRLGQDEVKRVRDSLDPLRRLERDRLSIESKLDDRGSVDAPELNLDVATKAEANIDRSAPLSEGSEKKRDANRGEVQQRANAEGRGRLRLPGRAVERATRDNDAAPNLGEATRDRASNLGEAARDVLNRGNSRANEQRDANRQVDPANAMRPARPQDWPSPTPRDFKRNLPNRPRVDGSRIQPNAPAGTPARERNNTPGKRGIQVPEGPNGPRGLLPSNPALDGKGGVRPGARNPKASDSVAPSVEGALNRATEGATGGGNAVSDVLGGVLGG